MSWVQGCGLVRSERKLAQYEDWRITELAASIYPDASGPDLDVAADALGWFTLLDDQFDGDRRFRVGWVIGLRGEFMRCLAGDAAGPGGGVPLVRAWADLCPRMLDGMSAGWAERAAGCWQAHFEACADEASLTADGPDAAARYLAVRRASVGGYLGTVLLERALRCEVPRAVRETPQFPALRRGVADVAVFLNDVCSLEREKARGDRVNLAILLQDSLGWSEARAVRDILRRSRASAVLAGEQQRELLALCPKLGLTASQQSAVRRFTAGTSAVVAGLHHWYATTSRYAGPEIGDGAVFGFEDLLSSRPRARKGGPHRGRAHSRRVKPDS